MNGQFDSSKTRVQPVLNQLFFGDRSGYSWLARLFRLGSRAQAVQLPNGDGWPGNLIASPAFEFPMLPPEDYLQYLIDNPRRVDWSALEQVRGDQTRKRRMALQQGDEQTQAEAKSLIRGNRGIMAWYNLEGITKVDCALFAEKTWVLIEGKRTENLTERTTWDARRHQVFRNLDCLRSVCPFGRYFVLLIVEESSNAANQAPQLDQGEIAKDSWPHLGQDDATAMFQHYLGHTTWQRIAHEFQNIGLPGTVNDASLAGLTCLGR